MISWYWMDRFAELNEDINDQYGFEKLKNISGQLEKHITKPITFMP